MTAERIAALTYGSLFAGAGGFDLGFDAAGWRCAWQVEIDTTCQTVLRRHWPDVPKHTDIREVGAHNLAPVDCIIGGWPCQDHSVAGKRAGFDGTRSSLFHEFARIVAELRPRWVCAENVPGLLSQRAEFSHVIGRFDDLGYVGCWRVLDAQFFGVPQRRRRVFLVASAGGGNPAAVLFESESVRGDSAARRAAGQDVAATLGAGSPHRGFGTGEFDGHGAYDVGSVARPLSGVVSAKWAKGTGGPAGDECYNLIAQSVALRGRDGGAAAELGGTVAGALRGSQGGGDKAYALTASNGHHGHNSPRADGSDNLVVAHTLTAPDPNAKPVNGKRQDGSRTDRIPIVSSPLMVRRLTPRECERLQGWPDDHTRFRDDGTEIADSHRNRMIGNGVASPVAAWIAARMREQVP